MGNTKRTNEEDITIIDSLGGIDLYLKYIHYVVLGWL